MTAKWSEGELSRRILSMTSPTIILHQGCESMCPDWILEKIRIERVVDAAKPHRVQAASDWEALAYLHTASFTAPPSELGFRIYISLFQKLMPEHAKALQFESISLTDVELDELERLKKWIYRQREKRERERCHALLAQSKRIHPTNSRLVK